MKKYLWIFITIGVLIGAALGAQTGTFSYYTDGTQTATKTVPLYNPGAVDTNDIVDGAVTYNKLDGIYLTTSTYTVNDGDTSLAAGVRVTQGLLFVGGLTYDLSDAGQVTLDNSGATTTIHFTSSVVGTHTAVLLRLR